MKTGTISKKGSAVAILAILACILAMASVASVSSADAEAADEAPAASDEGADEAPAEGSADHTELIALVVIAVLLLAIAGVAHLHYHGKE